MEQTPPPPPPHMHCCLFAFGFLKVKPSLGRGWGQGGRRVGALCWGAGLCLAPSDRFIIHFLVQPPKSLHLQISECARRVGGQVSPSERRFPCREILHHPPGLFLGHRGPRPVSQRPVSQRLSAEPVRALPGAGEALPPLPAQPGSRILGPFGTEQCFPTWRRPLCPGCLL